MMFLKSQLINDKVSILLNALSEYQIDLERGNYDTLNAYSHKWEAEVVWGALSESINGVSKNLLLSTQEVAHFSSQLRKEHLIRFALIAQFIAVLHLLPAEKRIKPEDELNYLNKNSKIALYVEAGMPGGCLIYFNAIVHSLLNTQSKLSALTQILISLEKNKEQFAFLSDLTMHVFVQHWLELFEQLEPEFKNNFMVSKEEHLQRASHCLSTEEAQKKLTIIEKYTLKILEKLHKG
ncbi:hypothetical protein [Legionella steigerwaltii]|nr:hypothetical protein [Legionella steigerwaltii]